MIVCFIGLHRWKYSGRKINVDGFASVGEGSHGKALMFHSDSKHVKRQCACGKKQYLSVERQQDGSYIDAKWEDFDKDFPDEKFEDWEN